MTLDPGRRLSPGGVRSCIDEIEVVNADGTASVEGGHCSWPERRRIGWSPSTA
jgi:hypothetical protein